MRIWAMILIAVVVNCHADIDQVQSEPATLPYRMLCQMAQLDLVRATGLTNQDVTFTIGSKNPNVKIEDISMFIDAKAGRIPLHISTNGILTLPVSIELAKENPRIVSNQPKGSMNLDATLLANGRIPRGATRDEEGMIRYSALFITEKIKQEAVSGLTEFQQEHDLKGALARPSVIHFQVTTNAASAEVIIFATGGEMRLKPTAPGRFVLRFDPELMKQDPWVKLIPKHQWSIKMETESDTEPEVGGYRR